MRFKTIFSIWILITAFITLYDIVSSINSETITINDAYPKLAGFCFVAIISMMIYNIIEDIGGLDKYDCSTCKKG